MIDHMVPLVVVTFVLAFVSGCAGLSTPCGWNSLFVILGARNNRTRPTGRATLLGVFGVGLILGSQVVAVLAIVVGWALRTTIPGFEQGVLFVLGAVSLAYASVAFSGRRLRVPTGNWVVPRSWHALGASTFVFRFGLALGFGYLTIVSFIGSYVLLALLLVLPSWVPPLAMLIFASGRWAMAAAGVTAVTLCESAGYNPRAGLLVATHKSRGPGLALVGALSLASVTAVAVLVLI